MLKEGLLCNPLRDEGSKYVLIIFCYHCLKCISSKCMINVIGEATKSSKCPIVLCVCMCVHVRAFSKVLGKLNYESLYVCSVCRHCVQT